MNLGTDYCKKCVFYVPFHDDSLCAGLCHRYPPVFIGMHGIDHTQNEMIWDHPTVDSGGLCGEFKPNIVGASIPAAIEKSP